MSDIDNIPEEEDEIPKAPFWMTTFSDMATILLTFFVLIVSMSEVEVKKFHEAFSHFNGRRFILQFESAFKPPIPYTPTSAELIERAERYENLLEFLDKNNMSEMIRVNLTDEGLHVNITDSLMFTSGSAELLPDSRDILIILSEVLGEAASFVEVQGHTDNVPINTGTFASNWELSAHRAASVVRFLLSQSSALDPTRYSAIGRGEFHPIDTNDTPGRRARNRRVELLFVAKHG